VVCLAGLEREPKVGRGKIEVGDHGFKLLGVSCSSSPMRGISVTFPPRSRYFHVSGPMGPMTGRLVSFSLQLYGGLVARAKNSRSVGKIRRQRGVLLQEERLLGGFQNVRSPEALLGRSERGSSILLEPFAYFQKASVLLACK
jgi:hypothetical protein